MKYPIDWLDTANAYKDPKVRGAGAGIAFLILLIGGLFLLGPIILAIIPAFLGDFLWFLPIIVILGIIDVFKKK